MEIPMLPYRISVRLLLCALFVALTAAAAAARQRTDFGTLSIDVRPPNAEIFIDGERWTGPEGTGVLQIELSPGPHRVEMRSPGRRPYVGNVTIRAGETTRLNVLLTPGEPPTAPQPPAAPAPPEAPGPPVPPSGNIVQTHSSEDGFVFAPDYRVSEINHHTGQFLGAYGGYVFAGQFMIGAGGYWQVDSTNGVHLAYGGPVVEWRLFPERTIGFNLHGLVGGGWTYADHGYYGRSYMNGMHPQPYDGHYYGNPYGPYYYDQGFFVAEPEAQIVIRFGDFARLQGGVGYRAVSEHGLSGVSGGISVQFGR
jgi:hypothetical protein